MTTLDQATAQHIVDRAMPVIGHSVNVMTPEGIIIASGDARRVGELHQGARLVAQTGEALVVNDAQAEKYLGVRAGVNLPIRLDQTLVAVVGISGTPERVLPFADLLRITAELILEQAALLEVTHHRRHQIENTLLALIDGKPVPESWLRQLGLDLESPRIAVIVEVEHRPSQAATSLPIPRSEPQQLSADTLFVQNHQGQTVFFFTDHSGEEATNAALACFPKSSQASLVTATGASFSNNLQACYQSASAALRIGKQRRPEGNRFQFREFPLAALWNSLEPTWQQQELSQAIAPLLAHPRQAQYTKTLRTFIQANGDIKRCANMLHLHRNSIRYRLNGIESLTGYSPFNTENLLLLYLALETAKQTGQMHN